MRSTKYVFGIFVGALSCLLFTSLSFAEVPKLISYSGRMANKTGAIVNDDTYAMTFSLWTASSGGTKVWEEVHDGANSVVVTAGAFNVALGGITGLPPFNVPYWLEVTATIDSTIENFGRQQLLSVPYAIGIDLPVGIILPWHKNMGAGAPPLPSQYVQCDGQTLNDPESPFNGYVIPNINGNPTGANSPDTSGRYAMFLRGGVTSGMGQMDEFKSHTHSYTWRNGSPAHGVAGSAHNERDSVGTTGATGGSETRPVNMSVVWIMKIK